MTTTVSTSLVGELILARLLTSGKKAPRPKQLRDDIGRFFKHPPNGEQWQEYVEDLVNAGLLTTGPYELTDAGRAQAFKFLGLESLPPRTNWKTLRARYLVPKALGLAPDADDLRKRLAKAENLAAFLLKEGHDLPVGAGASLNQVLEALVCKELGFPGEATFAGLKQVVLMRLLGATERLSKKQVEKQLPRHLLGANKAGVDGLHEMILQHWVEGPSAPHEQTTASPDAALQTAPFDLPAFAATVRAAARDCPTGRFGDNKVFISHVWRYLAQEPGFPQLDLATFKTHLAEANHEGLLHLSRADLVEVMGPADVQESETAYLNARFHFILLEGDRS